MTVLDKKLELENTLELYVEYLFSEEFSTEDIEKKSKLLYGASLIIEELKGINQIEIGNINQKISTRIVEYQSKL